MATNTGWKRHAFGICSLTICLVLLLPDMAHAGYLDPGSGSTLVQGIIATLAAVKRFWRGIVQGVRRFLGRGSQK